MPKKYTYIGFVGSRKLRKETVSHKINDYMLNMMDRFGKKDITIVSGGAKGVDTYSIEIAKEFGLRTLVYLPKNDEYSSKFDDDGNLIFQGKYNKIYFERNKRIVDMVDILIAFPYQGKGGTMNTIVLFRTKCRILGIDTYNKLYIIPYSTI